jgi:hypothetical protein
MHPLRNVHEINENKDHPACLPVCLSVPVIQLKNRWTDLDEIWYERFATEVDPKTLLFSFLQSVISQWGSMINVRLKIFGKYKNLV